MSVFIGGGPEIDYPAYLVKFTLTGATHFGTGTWGFFLANASQESPALPAEGGVLGYASDSGLIGAIASYLGSNGWDGGTVSDLTVTEYTEASADVTP